MSAGQARRSLKQFIIGKACSAVLTFSLLLLVARSLPTADYGAYLTVFAAVEFCGSIALLGYDWMIYRYLPEIRLHATEAQQRQFLRKTLSRHAVALFALALLLPAALYFWQSHLSLSLPMPLLIACGVWLLMEHGARLVRDGVFSSLLMQGWSQGLAALRSGLMLALVAALYFAQSLSLSWMIFFELITAIILFLITHWRLWFKPWPLNMVNGTFIVSDSVSWNEMRKLGLDNYFAAQLALLQGPQVLTMLANYYFGLTGAALYGFVRNVSEQIRKYLPAEILMGVVRPILLNKFSIKRCYTELGVQVSTLYRVSSIVLIFVILPLVVSGDWVVSILGGAKLSSAAPLLLIMIMGLLPFSHRRFLELYCNSVGASDIWLKVSFFGVALFPIMLVLLPIWGLPIIALYSVAVELIANLLILKLLAIRRFDYPNLSIYMFKYFLFGFFSVAVFYFLMNFLIANVFVSISLAVIFWFSLLVIGGFLSKKDILFIKSIFS